LGKNKTYRTQLEGIDEYMFIEFDTNREAKNFISYMQTDFARFCLGLYKKDFALNSNVDRIPLVDFTQKWTDEKLYAHFSITEEEQTFIKEVIPPYYD
jgi:small nuclear ribonucleoprotein (snRNP)-like protein